MSRRHAIRAAFHAATKIGLVGATLAAVMVPAGNAAAAVVSVAKVNFQPESSAVPAGYAKDFGQAFDATRKYGWVAMTTATPLSVVGNGRQRTSSAEQRYNTLMHMQLPAKAAGVAVPGRWEYALAAGTYDVTVAVGDTGPYFDSVHQLSVEGVSAVAGFVPTAARPTTTATVRVNVTDGRLTLSPAGGTNTKIEFVDIATVDTTPPPSWAAESAHDALGIFVPGGRTGIDPHEDWMGRDVNFRLHFASWDTWGNASNTFSSITDPKSGYVANNTRTLVLGMGLTMREDSSGSTQARAKLTDAANGANDAFWTSIGQIIHQRGLDVPYPDGRPRIVLRVGWEHNGTWYPWSSNGNEELYAQAWRRAHDRVEAAAPATMWSWGLTTEQSSPDAVRRSYPGDAYVDVVEVDVYDNYAGYVPVGGDAEPNRRVKAWDYKLNAKVGLAFVASLAAEHGKMLAIGEAGLVRQTTGQGQVGGGDNALFVANLAAWLDTQAAAGRLAWANYFEIDVNGQAHALRGAGAAPGSTAGSQYPAASAKFLELFGS